MASPQFTMTVLLCSLIVASDLLIESIGAVPGFNRKFVDFSQDEENLIDLDHKKLHQEETRPEKVNSSLTIPVSPESESLEKAEQLVSSDPLIGVVKTSGPAHQQDAHSSSEIPAPNEPLIESSRYSPSNWLSSMLMIQQQQQKLLQQLTIVQQNSWQLIMQQMAQQILRRPQQQQNHNEDQ